MGERGRPRSAASAAQDAPVFLGPPGRLRWAGTEGESAGPASPPVAVTLPAALAPFVDPRHSPLRRAHDPDRLRLRLAPGAPPGTYRIGVEYAGGRKQEVAIAIEPRPRLRVVPGTLRLAAPPGGAVSAQLIVENRGNQPLEIAQSLVAGLFDDNGIETALAAIYRLETDDLNEIVGHGFARLRAAHGGLLKLRVRAGAGTIAPGERRTLQLDTRLGRKLAPGHGYHGTLEFGPHRIAVRVSVGEPNPRGARP